MATPFTALFISNDPTIFDESSSTRVRMREYAKAIGTLHIISRCAGNYRGQADFQDGQLFLHALRGSKFLAQWSIPKRARELILKNNIDIVSAQDPFEYGLAAMRSIKGTNAKLHIQIHTDFLSPWFTRSGIARSPRTRMSSLNRIRQRIANRVLPHADGIRVVSKRISDSVIAKYGTAVPAPSIIPIFVPPALPPRVELPEHSFSFVLMAIGRLEPEKRIEDLLVALVQLKDLYPSLGLMIVGDGRERKRLEKWVETLELGGRVMFLGNRPDAVGLLQNANAFIQASAYEGYGRTLIEAALARVPIITTDVGIVGEVFKGYEDVLAAPPGDPKNLAVHITSLLEDVPVRQQFIMKAEKTVLEYLATVHAGPEDIAADLLKTLGKTT